MKLATAKKTPYNFDHVLTKLNNTSNHVKYNAVLADPNVKISVGIGAAGSGKTLLPATHALHNLLVKKIDKIVITRPAVTMEETVGYLPGDINNKMHPFIIPIYDSFKEYVSMQKIKEYIANEEIEICPMAFMRGRTFNNSWIIADEVQNTTVNQMKSLLTRIGHDSKMSLTGDLNQCDIKNVNGLSDFIKRLNKYNEESIKVVEFDENDVMRSDIVKTILGIYKD